MHLIFNFTEEKLFSLLYHLRQVKQKAASVQTLDAIFMKEFILPLKHERLFVNILFSE